MRRLLTIAIIVSTAMLSCDDDPLMYVEKNINLKKVYSIPINKTGAFEGSTGVALGRVIDELTGNLDGQLKKTGYTLKEINIKSLNLKLIRNTGNTAVSVNLSSAIINSDLKQVPLFSKNNIQINEVTIAAANADNFFGDGIENLNRDLEKVVKKIKPDAYITISVKGSSFPANTMAAVNIQIEIEYSMQYSYCEETLFLITDPIIRCVK